MSAILQTVPLGFPWATLVRGGVTLKLEKRKSGWGKTGFWSWRLPDNHPLRDQGPV